MVITAGLCLEIHFDSVATPPSLSWEQFLVKPSPASRRWGGCTAHLRHAPPTHCTQSATKPVTSAGPGRATPLTARPVDQRTKFLGRQDQKITEARKRRLVPLWAYVTIRGDPATRKVRWTGETSTQTGMIQN